MKPSFVSIQIACALAAFSARGQGTLIYDQQSSTEGNFGEAAPVIQSNQPIGQSFTPGLSSIGFVRLYLSDSSSANGLGATLSVNLRANSIMGTLLASTDPVFVPNAFHGPANFFFPTAATLTPGTIYYLQPVVQSGDNSFSVAAHNAFGYAGGTGFFLGQASQVSDLWFREGIVVPEPSAWALLLVGLGVLAWQRRKSR